MDRRLLEYLPPVVREIPAYQAINAGVEPEIALAWDALALAAANLFLDTADKQGVSLWEQELGLHPRDTDLLAVRKARLKALWNMETPYTVSWLKSWLTGLCGPEGHEETIADYTLHIQLDYNVLPDADRLAAEIMTMLLAVRPANIWVLMAAFQQSCGTVSHGAASELSQEIEVYPWIISERDSEGTLDHGAYTELEARAEVYPWIVDCLESRGSAAMVGTQEYHTTVEINPNEQEA